MQQTPDKGQKRCRCLGDSVLMQRAPRAETAIAYRRYCTVPADYAARSCVQRSGKHGLTDTGAEGTLPRMLELRLPWHSRHVGAEIAVSSLGPRLTPPAWLPYQHVAESARLALLCESREGYQNLCQLVTRFKMRETTKQEAAANFGDLQRYAPGLLCMNWARP